MVTLVSTGLWQLLKLLLFFMILTVLRHPGKMFCRISFSLVCLMFFSWLDWDCGFGGRIPQRWNTVLITACEYDVSQENHDHLITWYISLIGMLHKYHRLGSLNNRGLFYQFWKWEVQDQCASRAGLSEGFSPWLVGSCLSPLSLPCPSSSLCLSLLRTSVRLDRVRLYPNDLV